MSSGVFRGKESSNRIELSWLVQDLLNFGDLGFLWLWGVQGGWMGVGVVGGTPTHMHMHGKHDNFMQMAAPMGESLGIPYDVICVCACVGGTLLPPPYPSTHPPTPQGRTLESVKIQ